MIQQIVANDGVKHSKDRGAGLGLAVQPPRQDTLELGSGFTN